ncbi:hypothetical protein D3C76_1525050 [compost metagenome]
MLQRFEDDGPHAFAPNRAVRLLIEGSDERILRFDKIKHRIFYRAVIDVNTPGNCQIAHTRLNGPAGLMHGYQAGGARGIDYKTGAFQIQPIGNPA